jgi:hypothetical protein
VLRSWAVAALERSSFLLFYTGCWVSIADH